MIQSPFTYNLAHQVVKAIFLLFNPFFKRIGEKDQDFPHALFQVFLKILLQLKRRLQQRKAKRHSEVANLMGIGERQKTILEKSQQVKLGGVLILSTHTM